MIGKIMNKKTIATLIGIILIAFAIIPKIDPIKVIPIPTPSVNLDVQKPSEEILSLVNPINTMITNKEDRIKLAVFNYSFSKRVPSYSTQTQKINDIYVLAGENFFGESLKGKYPELASQLQNLFVYSMGENDHIISDSEKIALSNTFGGLSWKLIQ